MTNLSVRPSDKAGSLARKSLGKARSIGLFFYSRLAMSCLAAALLGVFLANATAQGEEVWPQRTITIVVPYGAGGSADLIARILAQHMQEDLGKPVVVENRAGGSGAIGSSFVAQAVPNGYTIGIGTLSTHVLNPLINSKLNFGSERDFQPISLLVQLPNLLIINPRIPAKTVPELISYLKANDGKVNYGSPGIRNLIAAFGGDVRVGNRHAYDQRAVSLDGGRVE